MSRSALITAAVIVVLTTLGSVAAIDSDPLGVLTAAALAFAALVLLIAVYIGDALIRSFRKARANDHFANPS